MESKPVLFLVGTDIVPGKEKEYNEWYDKTHLSMVLKCPGVMRAKRYQIVEPIPNFPKYLTIYELSNEASIEAMTNSPQLRTVREDPSKPFSDTDMTVKWRVHYKQITP
ncbi:hypothetical protein ACFLVK_02295 [Chloroflexota bacterium]